MLCVCTCLIPWWQQSAQHRAQTHTSTRHNGRCAPSEPRRHTRSMQLPEDTQSRHDGGGGVFTRSLQCADKIENGPWMSWIIDWAVQSALLWRRVCVCSCWDMALRPDFWGPINNHHVKSSCLNFICRRGKGVKAKRSLNKSTINTISFQIII